MNRCLPGNTFIANGLSWFNRDPTLPINLRTFDHAIVFLSQAKVLPSYYQYNYLDNVSRRLCSRADTALGSLR